MWRNLVGCCSHVDLLVSVNTGNDEENPRTSGSTREKTTKPEYDRSFIFLEYFKIKEIFREICTLGLQSGGDFDILLSVLYGEEVRKTNCSKSFLQMKRALTPHISIKAKTQ